MNGKRFSVIVPTLGRSTLRRLLESVVLGPEDELLLCSQGANEEVKDLASEFGFTYLVYDGPISPGGTAVRNWAIPQAKGDYLVFNDDSDTFLPEALEIIRQALPPEPKPLLFRVELPGETLLWHREPSTNEGEVDGHQFVPPNLPNKLGRWAENGHGDYHFIRETLALWDGYIPVDRVIARCQEAV